MKTPSLGKFSLPVALTLLLSLPSVAFSQSPLPSTPTDGLELPFSSPALQDDATALEVNPAGLAFMDTWEIGYGFELPRESLRQVANESQALFLAGGNQYFGAGFAFQSLDRPEFGKSLESYRKYTLGMALALPRSFSAGFNVNWFGSNTSE